MLFWLALSFLMNPVFYFMNIIKFIVHILLKNHELWRVFFFSLSYTVYFDKPICREFWYGYCGCFSIYAKPAEEPWNPLCTNPKTCRTTSPLLRNSPCQPPANRPISLAPAIRLMTTIFFKHINGSSQWHNYLSLSQHTVHIP
jgi:hypothetical protein